MRNIFITCLVLLFAQAALATTWNEPWQETVAKDATTLIRGRITSVDPKKGCTVAVVKHLAGEKTPPTFELTGFSLLELTSLSGGHPPTFLFEKDLEGYLFVKKADKEAGYLLATPTAGFAPITKLGVYATYSHSYHQALVDEELYETATTAIFNYLHHEKFDQARVVKEIDDLLRQPPAHSPGRGQDPTAAKLFFQQHVALESFYYFGTPEKFPLLEPFLTSSDRFVQISAVRALSRINTPQARQRLLAILEGPGDGFVRIMALWGLKRLDARELLPQLKVFHDVAPMDETGFGGRLMDPRIGTAFPESVKKAVAQLIQEWEAPPAKDP
jgi:hypothetical protein